MSGSVIIKYEPEGVCQLTLYRPEKRNALNIALLESLCFALDDLETDNDVRVILLAGEGPVFCAGLDLKESAIDAARDQAVALMARLLETLVKSSKTTIAAVHGAALAGGAGLMSACDLVVAEEDAVFGYPEVRRGLPAALVMCLLRRQIAERHAKELLILGETIAARRAYEMGLVNRVVPKGAAVQTALAMAATVLKGGPQAIAQSKRLLNGLWHRPIEEDFVAALQSHHALRGSPEAEEGFRAFNEKRLPNWDPNSKEGKLKE